MNTDVLIIDDWAGNVIDSYGPMIDEGLVAGAIHRLGQGLGYGSGQETWSAGDAIGSGDWLYDEHVTRSRAEGLEIGTYYVADPLYSVDQQLDWVCNSWQPNGRLKFWVDIELKREKSATFLEGFYHDFINAFAGKFGHDALGGDYSGDWFWPNLMRTIAGKAALPRWQKTLRHWWGYYPFPKGRVEASWGGVRRIMDRLQFPQTSVLAPDQIYIWQCSGDRFVCPGVRGPLDMNLMRKADFEQLVGSVITQPPAVVLPEPAPCPAQVQVVSPRGLYMRSSPASQNNNDLALLAYGKRLSVEGREQDAKGNTWFKISAYVAGHYNGQTLAREVK